jgi:hypothetical protein
MDALRFESAVSRKTGWKNVVESARAPCEAERIGGARTRDLCPRVGHFPLVRYPVRGDACFEGVLMR